MKGSQAVLSIFDECPIRFKNMIRAAKRIINVQLQFNGQDSLSLLYCLELFRYYLISLYLTLITLSFKLIGIVPSSGKFARLPS